MSLCYVEFSDALLIPLFPILASCRCHFLSWEKKIIEMENVSDCLQLSLGPQTKTSVFFFYLMICEMYFIESV